MLVNPFMDTYTEIDGNRVELCAGIYAKIRRELVKLEQVIHPRWSKGQWGGIFNEEYLKIVLDRMCKEAGVNILFHTTLINACAENGSVKSVEIHNKSGNTTIYADYFIDATADADLCTYAGFKTDIEKDNCQAMTLNFRLSNAPSAKELYSKYWSEVHELY